MVFMTFPIIFKYFDRKAAEQFESHMADIFGAAGVSPMSTEEFDNSIKQKLAGKWILNHLL